MERTVSYLYELNAAAGGGVVAAAPGTQGPGQALNSNNAQVMNGDFLLNMVLK